MTRQEFIRNTTTWRELIDFCYIYDCSVCDDILARTDLPGFINSDLIDYQGQYSWTTIRDLLFAIVDTADYYCREGFLDYASVDDSFEAYKADVLAWCDEDASIFDDEDDEDDFIITEDEPDDEEPDLSDGDCSDDDLLELLEKKFY